MIEQEQPEAPRLATISLRDWYAGMSLTGLMRGRAFTSPDDIAQHAYLVADAMLAARGEQ